MDSPSILIDYVEGHLRTIQEVKSSQPWLEVKQRVMEYGQSAFVMFDKFSGYESPLRIPLRDIERMLDSVSLEDHYNKVSRMLDEFVRKNSGNTNNGYAQFVRKNSSHTKHDYAQYAKEFLGAWEVFYQIVTSKWPEARFERASRSRAADSLCVDLAGRGMFSTKLWNEAVNSAVEDSTMTELEGYEAIICAFEANLEQSNADKWERFKNLLTHKFESHRLVLIKGVLHKYYELKAEAARPQPQSSMPKQRNTGRQSVIDSDSSESDTRTNSNVPMATRSSGSNSKKRSYEEANSTPDTTATATGGATAATAATATTTSSALVPSTSSSAPILATLPPFIAATASTALAMATTSVPVDTAESEEVPLKMRVKILKFLTKNGDATHKKEAMRQLMVMATKK